MRMRHQRHRASWFPGHGRGAFDEALIATTNDGTGDDVDLGGDIGGNRVVDLRVEHWSTSCGLPRCEKKSCSACFETGETSTRATAKATIPDGLPVRRSTRKNPGQIHNLSGFHRLGPDDPTLTGLTFFFVRAGCPLERFLNDLNQLLRLAVTLLEDLCPHSTAISAELVRAGV